MRLFESPDAHQRADLKVARGLVRPAFKASRTETASIEALKCAWPRGLRSEIEGGPLHPPASDQGCKPAAGASACHLFRFLVECDGTPSRDYGLKVHSAITT